MMSNYDNYTLSAFILSGWVTRDAAASRKKKSWLRAVLCPWSDLMGHAKPRKATHPGEGLTFLMHSNVTVEITAP